MNPNIYNQAIYPFNFYIPPISSLQNPTANDFERLIERYQRYFFYIINQQRNYPRAKENFYIKHSNVITFTLQHVGKGYHSSTHYNIHVLCLIYSLCSS